MGTAIFYHKMSQEGSILKKFTSAFGRLFLSAVLIFLVFYTMMPAINLHDQDFIVFLIICILIVLAVNFMESILIFLKTVQQNRGVEIVPRSCDWTDGSAAQVRRRLRQSVCRF